MEEVVTAQEEKLITFLENKKIEPETILWIMIVIKEKNLYDIAEKWFTGNPNCSFDEIYNQVEEWEK